MPRPPLPQISPRVLFGPLLVVLVLAAVSQPAFAAPLRLVGYATARTDFARLPAERLTHLNYAFAVVNPAGDVVLPSPTDAGHLAQLVALRSRHPDLRILLSVGGWGADHFSDAALTANSRARFARSAVALIQQHHLDGLDVDWEYPGQPGPGIKFRPEDKTNFTLLLADLRQHLDAASAATGRTGVDRYLLTIATSDGKYFAHTEMSVLHRFVD